MQSVLGDLGMYILLAVVGLAVVLLMASCLLIQPIRKKISSVMTDIKKKMLFNGLI